MCNNPFTLFSSWKKMGPRRSFLRFGQLLHEHTKSKDLAPISQEVLMIEFVGRSKTTDVSHARSASTANSIGRKCGTSQHFKVETRIVFHEEEHFVPGLNSDDAVQFQG